MKLFKNESGRSMVEMLGVLAIIGVLSIGGISVYQYAMKKIAANEFMTVISRYIFSLESEFAKENAFYNNIVCEEVYTATSPEAEACLFEATDLFCNNYLGQEYCQKKYTTTYPQYYAGYDQKFGFMFSVFPMEDEMRMQVSIKPENCLAFMEAFANARSTLDQHHLIDRVALYDHGNNITSQNYQYECQNATKKHIRQWFLLNIRTYLN